jgi:hypothetical protein
MEKNVGEWEGWRDFCENMKDGERCGRVGGMERGVV